MYDNYTCDVIPLVKRSTALSSVGNIPIVYGGTELPKKGFMFALNIQFLSDILK